MLTTFFLKYNTIPRRYRFFRTGNHCGYTLVPLTRDLCTCDTILFVPTIIAFVFPREMCLEQIFFCDLSYLS